MLFCDEEESFWMEALSCNWHPRVQKKQHMGYVCIAAAMNS